MPSELERVAQGLVECLDQVPQIVAHLQRTAAWCRQQAGLVGDMSRESAGGRAAALHLEAAASACEEAAQRASLAPAKARNWAQSMVNVGASAGAATEPATPAIPGIEIHPTTTGQPATEAGAHAWSTDSNVQVRDDVARRVATKLGLDSPGEAETLRDAYQVVHDFQAPFLVKLADDMLDDLRETVANNPDGQRVVFVGRDGRSLAIAVAQLDPEFFRNHCSEVVLSRALVESAVQDLEHNQGKSFPQLLGFRGAAKKVDSADTVGAVGALTDYLHNHGVPVGMPLSRVTLVDTNYKGTVQELLTAVYPTTTFNGRYAFFAESPHDPHPGSKKGYALHLNKSESDGGIPIDALPDDVARTFAHQDAIGSIEETLHGPLSSPKRIKAGLPAQAHIRNVADALD